MPTRRAPIPPVMSTATDRTIVSDPTEHEPIIAVDLCLGVGKKSIADWNQDYINPIYEAIISIFSDSDYYGIDSCRKFAHL